MTSVEQPWGQERFGAAAPGARQSASSLEPLLTAPQKPTRGLTWHRVLVAASGVVIAVGGFVAGHYTWPSPKPPIEQFVVTSGGLPAGAKLTSADLRVIQVRPGDAVPSGALSPAAAARLLGQITRISMPGGTILSQSLLGTTGAVPGPAQALVGLALKPGELPEGGLAVGQRVTVVELRPNSAGTSVIPTQLVVTDVWNLHAPDSSGNVQATVVVPARLATQLSGYAALGDVALVGAGPGATSSAPTAPISSSPPRSHGRKTTKSRRTR